MITVIQFIRRHLTIGRRVATFFARLRFGEFRRGRAPRSFQRAVKPEEEEAAVNLPVHALNPVLRQRPPGCSRSAPGSPAAS